MKNKFISICITLILFCCSLVPVFATEVVADNLVEYWLHDLLNQSYLSTNAGSVNFGLGVGNAVTSYVARIKQGGTFYVTYEVAPGDTVYFRWAQIRNNIPSIGSTVVNTSVNGSRVNSNTYTRAVSSSDDTGTYGTVLIVEDYTNNTNAEQTVSYTITFNGDGGTATGDYIPILCGTSVLINADKIETDISNLPTFDLTNVEDKLDSIIDLLENTPHELNLQLPFEMWQVYSLFMTGYGYVLEDNDTNIPWLIRTETQPSYVDDLAFRGFTSDTVYFSFLSACKDRANVRLVRKDGTSILGEVFYNSVRNNTLGNVYTYKFNVTPGEYYTLYLADYEFFDKIIPFYIGDGSDITENLEFYTGLTSANTKRTNTIIDILNSISSGISNLYNYFKKTSPNIDDAITVTDNLNNSINQMDNIEKQQVDSFTNNVAALPTFDFNGITDFSTTAMFVSTQMQNIYNSSEYIRFMFTAVLTFGIALVLIGRGLHR